MLFACNIRNLLAIVLLFLRISPLLFRIMTIVLLYTAALFFCVVYIKSIWSGKGVFRVLIDFPAIFQHCGAPAITWPVLLLSSLVPVAPAEGKPSQRLTKAEKHQLSLSAELKGILVGLILGDLNFKKHTKNSNVIFRFEQGLVHNDYLFHLYELFKGYCLSAPSTSNRLPDKRTGNGYTRVTFYTKALPCFNEHLPA